jgi:hypothetical protein
MKINFKIIPEEEKNCFNFITRNNNKIPSLQVK